MNIKSIKVSKQPTKDEINKIIELDLDCLVIIHKVELRLFLLGRNGLYNDIIDSLYEKTSKFFLLIIFNILFFP